MTTSVGKFARHDTNLSFLHPDGLCAAAGHLTPTYPTHRKDKDILASHRLMANIRSFMVSSAGYDKKKRLKEASRRLVRANRSPVPIHDPFVYVSDEKVRTVIGGKQPEPHPKA